MVMFHRLRHVYHIHFIFVIQQIVFAQIGMDKLALLIENPHVGYHLQIDFWKFFYWVKDRIFQFWSVNHILSDEIHEQNIAFHDMSYRTWNIALNSFEISHFFLCPHRNHLPWIARAVASSKSKLALNVSISVFKNQNRCFVNFNGIFLFCYVVDRVINIGLLSCW